MKLKGYFKEGYPIKTPPEQASKILPWVHTAISNAKSLLPDMYHGIKDGFLQSCLDEFCRKFNHRSFGDRLFDRLVVEAVSCRPMFQHRTYAQGNHPTEDHQLSISISWVDRCKDKISFERLLLNAHIYFLFDFSNPLKTALKSSKLSPV